MMIFLAMLDISCVCYSQKGKKASKLKCDLRCVYLLRYKRFFFLSLVCDVYLHRIVSSPVREQKGIFYFTYLRTLNMRSSWLACNGGGRSLLLVVSLWVKMDSSRSQVSWSCKGNVDLCAYYVYKHVEATITKVEIFMHVRFVRTNQSLGNKHRNTNTCVRKKS